MTTAQVVEMSVTANNNSPIQDYVHLDDQSQPTFEIALYLFYKNEVYTEKLVEFRMYGLNYYLRTSHKSYKAKDYGDKNT